MTSFYQNLAATAARLIKEKGGPLQVHLVLPGVYDPATSTKTPDGVAIRITSGLLTHYATRDVDGKTILRSDRKLLLAAAGLIRAPRGGDKVVFTGAGSDTYSVIAAESISPGQVPLVYIVQLRK